MTAAIDFLRPEAPPRLGWLLLLAGAGALVAALAFDRHYAAAQAEVERMAQARLEQDRQRLRPARLVAPTAAEVRLRQADADSRAPWLATLRAIESTTRDPVYLRSLVIEPASGAIKLDAEAPSFAEALSYAKALDDESSLRPAFLSSHEQVVDPATGKSVVRFNVSGRWNSR